MYLTGAPLLTLCQRGVKVRHKNKQPNCGGEMVPEITEFSEAGFTGDALDTTIELVRRAETKLVGLHANRSQLRRRIRALHYLLKTLKTESSLLISTDSPLHPEAGESKFSQNERPKFERGSDTAASPVPTNEPTTVAPAVTGVSPELRRACRIALLESDRPQCCEQILQRIQRRESVCIELFGRGVNAIEQELRAMLADGEVIQKKDNQHWQLNRDSGHLSANVTSRNKTSTRRSRTQSG